MMKLKEIFSLQNWLKKEQISPNTPKILVDIHSHLLPNIDDGVKTLDQAYQIILRFVALGYKKLIITPHIMQDFYPNNATIIMEKLEELKNYLIQKQINITLEAAAEYYLDEFFLDKLHQAEPLLTFGDNYILFETGFMNEPFFLEEAIFTMKSNGYIPVLAHPERYLYLYNQFERLEALCKDGLLLQVNANALTGYYSDQAKHFAKKLIEKKLVSFVGSDCHHEKHVDTLEKVQNQSLYQMLGKNPLLNNTLL